MYSTKRLDVPEKYKRMKAVSEKSSRSKKRTSGNNQRGGPGQRGNSTQVSSEVEPEGEGEGEGEGEDEGPTGGTSRGSNGSGGRPRPTLRIRRQCSEGDGEEEAR